MPLPKMIKPIVVLWALAFALVSCSKESEKDRSAGSGEATSQESASSDGKNVPAGTPATIQGLSYKESVRAGFDELALAISFMGEDQTPQSWSGTLTIVKDRFATVEHTNSLQKLVHLRRWADVHIANIPDSGQPPADKTQQSQLTNKRFEAELMDSGGWKHFIEGVPRERTLPSDIVKLVGELDRVESGAALFYLNRKLDVGESWQVPVEGMARWFGNTIDDFSGDINVKVDRLGTVQEQPCTVLSVSLDVIGKMRDPDGQALDVALQGNGEIWRSTDLNLDLKVDIVGTAELKASVETNEIKMTVQGPLKITEERTLRLKILPPGV